MKKITLVILIMLTAFNVFSSGNKEEVQKNAKPVEISFWYAFSDTPRSGWIQDRISEFNKANPDFKVIGENKGSYRETLQAAVLGARQGDAPHIVQVFEVGSQIAYDSGIFKPVGSIGSFDTTDYIQPVLNYYTINNKVNSIPFNSSSPILYINQDKMVQAGFDADYAPETFDEVLNVLEKAKNAGVEGSNLSFNLHGWFYEQWMAEQGAPLVNNGNGRTDRATEVLLTSDASKKIFNWIKILNDNELYTYTGKLEDWSGSDAIFQEGKAMLHITSTADLGNITSAVEGKFTLKTGRLPIPDSVERNGVVIGGASVWITKDHPENELMAARDFVLYMTNTDNMISWHKLTGYYPVRNSSVDKLKENKWFIKYPNQVIAFTQLLETKPNSATGGALMGTFMDTRTIVEKAIQRVLNGGNVNKVLEEAKILADAKLHEYNANLQ